MIFFVPPSETLFKV